MVQDLLIALGDLNIEEKTHSKQNKKIYSTSFLTLYNLYVFTPCPVIFLDRFVMDLSYDYSARIFHGNGYQ